MPPPSSPSLPPVDPAPGSPATVVVHPDLLAALADGLAALSAELADEQLSCRSAAAGLTAALGDDGRAGSAATATATAWAGVLGELAERGRQVADALRSVAAAYRTEEADLAASLAQAVPR